MDNEEGLWGVRNVSKVARSASSHPQSLLTTLTCRTQLTKSARIASKSASLKCHTLPSNPIHRPQMPSPLPSIPIHNPQLKIDKPQLRALLSSILRPDLYVASL